MMEGETSICRHSEQETQEADSVNPDGVDDIQVYSSFLVQKSSKKCVSSGRELHPMWASRWPAALDTKGPRRRGRQQSSSSPRGVMASVISVCPEGSASGSGTVLMARHHVRHRTKMTQNPALRPGETRRLTKRLRR